MSNIEIYQSGSNQKTNSKNIASVFKKEHRHVLRDIKKLDCSDEFRESNFGLSSYTSSQGKVLPCVEMTKDGFVFLCMGYSGSKAAEFKEAYICEFNRMASTLNNFDKRASDLCLEGKELKEAGAKWSQLGRDLRLANKTHKEKSQLLIEEVQIKIEF